jgi:hypothetical protein
MPNATGAIRACIAPRGHCRVAPILGGVMKNMRGWCAALLLVCTAAAGAQERPYQDGPVAMVTSVKVVDGQFENYMEYLGKTWRQVMEESKAAGIVLEYHVMSAQPHSPDDPDLYLVVLYPNMATFDDFDKKMDPISAKVTKMTIRQQDEASGKRTVMRTILGQEMLRELAFK